MPILLAGLVAGCAGIMQEALPDRLDRFERRASGELRIGSAEVDITPPDQQYLAGFGLARKSSGVHLPLKARALVVVCGAQRVAIVGVDSLGFHREDTDWIKAGIRGFANGSVFLCASHTHAAPDLIGFWGFYLMSSGRDRAYVTLLRERISAAVAQALGNAKAAVLMRGEGRLPPRGLAKNSNYKELFDRRLTVLHAKAKDGGAPLATLLHLACHPEVLRRDNSLISADFVGDLCDRWRADGLGQAVFVNGPLGAMVTPDGWPRGVEGTPRVGGGIFDVAKQALAMAKPVPAEDIEIRRRDVLLPMRSTGLGLGRMTLVIPRRLYDGHVLTGVGYLRLGPIEIATVPGEIEPGLAERIRRQAHRPDLLVFGLVDDEVGYLMNETDAHDPHLAYELGMSPGPEAGDWVSAALLGVPTATR